MDSVQGIAREYQRLVVAEFRAKQRAYQHEYWLKNKDRKSAQRKQRDIEHPEIRKEQRRMFYEKNKTAIKQAWKEYRLANKSKVAMTGIKYRKSPKGRLQMYTSAAISRGLDFKLATDEFNNLLLSPCHYCGKQQAMGIDRKDNKIGYFSYNVVACCWPCNFMKSTSSYQEFVEKIERIYSHLHSNIRKECQPSSAFLS